MITSIERHEGTAGVQPNALFGDIYRGRTVLVTGHTGFKGSWLSLWLTGMGARVVGYSLPLGPEPSHFGLLQMDLVSLAGDVRDLGHLTEVLRTYRPEAIFHLAAQALVRRSYSDPLETFGTNIQGTINVYEACRAAPGVRAVVAVTSDKCYENDESARGYRESDPMGGSDPYSCSKGCAELITACYRRSFFTPAGRGAAQKLLLASARAGNVIGGGDWAEDRLVPDAVKAAALGQSVLLRNPRSIRPWQHVLEPLAGYLTLGQRLLEGRADVAGPWNFGPADAGNVEVEAVIRNLQEAWPRVRYEVANGQAGPHEARLLHLDSSQARARLGWKPVWDWKTAVAMTASWYRQYFENGKVTSRDALHRYLTDARTCQSVGAGE